MRTATRWEDNPAVARAFAGLAVDFGIPAGGVSHKPRMALPARPPQESSP